MLPIVQNPSVSADCLDILERVLVAEPSKRISMEQIKTHRWFTKGLPPGALEMNEYLLQGLSTMDDVSSCADSPATCSNRGWCLRWQG